MLDRIEATLLIDEESNDYKKDFRTLMFDFKELTVKKEWFVKHIKEKGLVVFNQNDISFGDGFFDDNVIENKTTGFLTKEELGSRDFNQIDYYRHCFRFKRHQIKEQENEPSFIAAEFIPDTERSAINIFNYLPSNCNVLMSEKPSNYHRPPVNLNLDQLPSDISIIHP